MKKKILHLLVVCMLLIPSQKIIAWGPEGHAIVGRLAMQFVTDDVRKKIQEILGTMSIDTAANWMDIMKSNTDYDFMRSWHYLDFPREQAYQVSNNENIINRLVLTFNELNHKKILCSGQIRTDLLVLLHLMGDLHMPLHTGYEDDLGGNKITVQYDTIKTHNLHRFWDEDIIALKKITDQDCLKYLESYKHETSKSIDFTAWMQESRGLLAGVYDYPGFMLDDAYLNKNKIVVEKQLLKAGLRLATILNKLFCTTSPPLDFKKIVASYKNGIVAEDAINNVNKKVTVCAQVFSVRFTNTITQINLGAKFPNTSLTIIIFGKSYKNFDGLFEDTFKDKNICVKGTIELYKGKAQIIVEKPEDITTLPLRSVTKHN